MSIKKVEMFTVICDNCKKSADEDSPYSCWNDKEYAEDVAMENDFIKEDDKHYCRSCYTFDKNNKLVINICKKCNGKGWYLVDEFIGKLQGRKDCNCKKMKK